MVERAFGVTADGVAAAAADARTIAAALVEDHRSAASGLAACVEPHGTWRIAQRVRAGVEEWSAWLDGCGQAARLVGERLDETLLAYRHVDEHVADLLTTAASGPSPAKGVIGPLAPPGRPADDGSPADRPADTDRPTDRPADTGPPADRPADSDRRTDRPADDGSFFDRPAGTDRPTDRPADDGSFFDPVEVESPVGGPVGRPVDGVAPVGGGVPVPEPVEGGPPAGRPVDGGAPVGGGVPVFEPIDLDRPADRPADAGVRAEVR
ncbi:MAG: hypothetical protein HOV94_25400 [Saccharothrix sp.]|nr:hypothetical protein [Saccharothrix sp.]